MYIGHSRIKPSLTDLSRRSMNQCAPDIELASPWHLPRMDACLPWSRTHSTLSVKDEIDKGTGLVTGSRATGE